MNDLDFVHVYEKTRENSTWNYQFHNQHFDLIETIDVKKHMNLANFFIYFFSLTDFSDELLLHANIENNFKDKINEKVALELPLFIILSKYDVFLLKNPTISPRERLQFIIRNIKVLIHKPKKDVFFFVADLTDTDCSLEILEKMMIILEKKDQCSNLFIPKIFLKKSEKFQISKVLNDIIFNFR